MNYGKIIHGIEPEFEEVETICDNFDELIRLLKTDK